MSEVKLPDINARGKSRGSDNNGGLKRQGSFSSAQGNNNNKFITDRHGGVAVKFEAPPASASRWSKRAVRPRM